MTEIIVLITAVIFYFLGKYSHTTKEKQFLEQTYKKLKRSKVSTGQTRVLTPQERKYKGSVQEQVDDKMRETLQELIQK